MTKDIGFADEVPLLGSDWFDPLEVGVRHQIRGFIETMLEEELVVALGRGRYDRAAAARGHRNGHRDRQLLGTFGPMTVSVPRARVTGGDGKSAEWRSHALPAYRRLTVQAERLIAGAYLAGTNTRRVRRALAALFGGAVGKDTVSRTWHKVRSDWEAWQKRDLAGDDIVRLILDGTVVRVRLVRKATSLSVLVALGVRRDGQKVLLALRNMGGESEAAWRALLDDLVARDHSANRPRAPRPARRRATPVRALAAPAPRRAPRSTGRCRHGARPASPPVSPAADRSCRSARPGSDRPPSSPPGRRGNSPIARPPPRRDRDAAPGRRRRVPRSLRA
ncbi:MAG: transposase, partial [Stellaceae bacterium]